MKKLLALILLLSSLAWSQGISYPASGPVYAGAGWPTLPNFKGVPIFSSNAGTGDVDLYTVGTGRRAVCVFSAWNSTASSITFYPEVKISSTYYAVNSKTTLASTATASTTAGLFDIILEAGQKCSVNTTGTGLNINGTAYTWDVAGSNLKSSVITSFINGDNTVYTCCGAGYTTAFVVGHVASIFNTAATTSLLSGWNNTAGTLTYHWNFVPSGGSAGTSNQITAAISSAATSGTPVTFGSNMFMAFASGDLVSVNGTSTNAAQIGWVNVVEQP
jgi:hypothetical protein